MLKLLSKLFNEKPPAIDYAQERGMERMSKRRRRTGEISSEVETVREQDEVNENEARKDILSKARDFEIGTDWKGFRNAPAKDMGSLIKDWQDRVKHLPGFEIDPQF